MIVQLPLTYLVVFGGIMKNINLIESSICKHYKLRLEMSFKHL